MREPHPKGTAIDSKRRARWIRSFEGYRRPIAETHVIEWLAQFDDSDRDIAARLLDVVEFRSHADISKAYKAMLDAVPGWDPSPEKRRGRFAFAPFSSTAGESGDAMLHLFRVANNLNQRINDKLFLARSEIVGAQLGAEDSLVLVDDFVGTGKQAVEAYDQYFQELLAGIGRVFLITVAAYSPGAERVRRETTIELLAHSILKPKDSICDAECESFSSWEKGRLHRYCQRASPDRPWGFGGCGLVVVFAHQCPNNTVSMLHAKSNEWEPLFPRT